MACRGGWVTISVESHDYNASPTRKNPNNSTLSFLVICGGTPSPPLRNPHFNYPTLDLVICEGTPCSFGTQAAPPPPTLSSAWPSGVSFVSQRVSGAGAHSALAAEEAACTGGGGGGAGNSGCVQAREVALSAGGEGGRSIGGYRGLALSPHLQAH